MWKNLKGFSQPIATEHVFTNWLIIGAVAVIALNINAYYLDFDIEPWVAAISVVSAIIGYHIMVAMRYRLNIVIAALLLFPIVHVLNQTSYEIAYYFFYANADGVSFAEVMNRWLEYLPESFMETWYLVETGLVVLTIVLLAKMQSDSSGSMGLKIGYADTSYGGYVVDENSNESMRLTLSSALLLGSTFRKQVIARAKDKHHAIPLEIGINGQLLLETCLFFEKRENKFRVIIILLSLGIPAGMALQNIFVILLSLVSIIVTQFIKKNKERYDIIPDFQRDKYSEDNIRTKYLIKADKNIFKELTIPSQNLSAYTGFSPFNGAGINMGGWSFSVDLKRGSQDMDSRKHPEEFGIFEISSAIETAMKELEISGLSIDDHFFVHGTDLPGINESLADKLALPQQSLDKKTVARYLAKQSGLIRHYKWVKICGWGNDLIVSFFIRHEIKGKNLLVEVSKYLLTPLSLKYRKIENIAPYTAGNNFAWFLGTILISPLSIITSWLHGYVNFFQAIGEVTGSAERAQKRLINTTANYNYGAPASLRQTMCDYNFKHYYQQVDNELYAKTLEREILDSTVDFLQRHNIDISSLKENQSTILNTGIMVSGGDVKADSIAVGKGAKSMTNGIISKVKQTASA